MQYIGKLDTEKFKGITNKKIITEDVVLTGKQRQHILERHPEIYEFVKDKFNEIINSPDFILKDKSRENTALVIKTFQENGKTINVVLKLAVEDDDIKNKNSIITCIPIGKNRLKSYENNGKTIYKNE